MKWCGRGTDQFGVAGAADAGEPGARRRGELDGHGPDPPEAAVEQDAGAASP